MGKSYSKNNNLLVFGYVRRYETKYYIPESISQLVLTYYPDCSIYGIGRNGLSEFGLGDFKQLHKFELLRNMTTHCDDIKDIYVGDHRFVIKNIDDELYCAGKNTNGDTGIYGPDMLKSLQKIKYIQNKDSFINVISSGLCARHTFVAFADNSIYAFGWNQFGQFGNGRQNAYARTWKTKLNNLWKIKDISCGHRHSLFLTTFGSVYCCGMNEFGQCGIKMQNYNYNCILQMIPVASLMNITAIACGFSHSLCIDAEGVVYVFGSNEYGQLGFIPDENLRIEQPTVQETLQENETKIGIIRCGKNHSLFIDIEKKNAFLCGDNLHGQIGNNRKDISQVCLPYSFEYKGYTDKIIDGACGNKHTVLMTSDKNMLVAFGSNSHHQCSAKSKLEYCFEPNCINLNEIDCIQQNKKQIVSRVICGNDTTILAFKQD